ncbi:dihydroorotate dehydrogenase electron transfer subunit [Gephyromycinifex aptenodytis]|uniref:dihydroorotate dehydrogenase electron transfer subunit n=1 Tax=Gephyromycinifex aptenodytis TaxID=2716227 RepID=UPI001D02B830|nr:dihydroorotate dehydrogenase electron transfer subunit [Gephyromycinifex aptenodytis]
MSRNDAAARESTRDAAPKAVTKSRAEVTQVQATLVATRREGAYQYMTFAAPGVPDLARPGQFVALTVGGPTSSLLLRRSFSIHAACAGTDKGEEDILDIVVAPHAPGTEWLTSRAIGDVVDLVGPLGRPFPIPRERVSCVLVGGGYGSAALFTLAMALRERGCRVELVLGAASEDKLFGVYKANRCADAVTITTDDGSLGVKGWVSDVLPEVISRSDAAVVYACGPMAMLESVAKVAAEAGAVSQLAVEESMACGVGVCMTCVMPVVGNDGVTRMVRSCVEGPVFRGDRLRWDAIESGRCTVPDDALGAPVPAVAAGMPPLSEVAETEYPESAEGSPDAQDAPVDDPVKLAKIHSAQEWVQELPEDGGRPHPDPDAEVASMQAGER